MLLCQFGAASTVRCQVVWSGRVIYQCVCATNECRVWGMRSNRVEQQQQKKRGGQPNRQQGWGTSGGAAGPPATGSVQCGMHVAVLPGGTLPMGDQPDGAVLNEGCVGATSIRGAPCGGHLRGAASLVSAAPTPTL